MAKTTRKKSKTKAKTKSTARPKANSAKRDKAAVRISQGNEFRRFALLSTNKNKGFDEVYEAFLAKGGELAKTSAYVVFWQTASTVEALRELGRLKS